MRLRTLRRGDYFGLSDGPDVITGLHWREVGGSES